MDIPSVNAKLSKKINRSIVLKELYNTKPISRADIAKNTGLTPASITKIIEEFIEFGIVKELRKTKSSYGRKPVLIDINTDNLYIIGIYVARKSLSGIISNLKADILKKVSKDYSDSLDYNNICENVIDLIKELLKISKIDKKKVLGIGIAVPGPINTKRGEVIKEKINTKFPCNWSRIPLKEIVSDRISLPVFVDNCTNISALGENWFGNGRGFKNFVVLSFGEGVGGGLILENNLYSGEDDIVAEIGHTTVNVDGPRCDCGNYGCIEMFVKNKTILERYNNLIKKYPDCGLAKIKVTRVEDIYNYIDKNDPIYKEIIDHLANYLGTATINLINILNPEAIVISTNELKDIEMDILIEKILAMVRSRVYPVVRDKVVVVESKLKSEVQLIGAISLVLSNLSLE